MKNIILTTILSLITLLSFSQNPSNNENMIFERVNEFRIMNGGVTSQNLTQQEVELFNLINEYRISNNIEIVHQSQITDDLYVKISEQGYDYDSLMDDINRLTNYEDDLGALYLYSNIDSTLKSEDLPQFVMDYWTSDFNSLNYILMDYDFVDNTKYSAMVNVTFKEGKYHVVLIIHDSVKTK